MEDRDKHEILEVIEKVAPWAQVVVSAIPWIGGPIASIMGEYQTNRKLKRLKELIKGLDDDINNTAYIMSDDFLDLFEETARLVMNERTENKRKAYRNIIVNACDSTLEYDELEDNIDVLNKLKSKHIQILSILYNPDEYSDKYEESSNRINNLPVSVLRYGPDTIERVLTFYILEGWDTDNIYSVLSFLVNEGILKEIIIRQYYYGISDSRNSNEDSFDFITGLDLLRNRLTKKGMSFCNYIIERK